MAYGSTDTSCARKKEKNHRPCSPARANSECTVKLNECKGGGKYRCGAIHQYRIRDCNPLENQLVSFSFDRQVSIDFEPSRPNVVGSSIQIAQIKDSPGSVGGLAGETCLNQHFPPLLQYP